MRNIFKAFKENKRLLEENKLLKAQNEALTEFRKSFDNYYNDISGVKVITKNYDKKMVLSGTFSLDRDGMYCPTDFCKEKIINQISRQLLPFVEFDVVDNESYGTKDIVGRLTILMK
jgi:hypothetical protein